MTEAILVQVIRIARLVVGVIVRPRATMREIAGRRLWREGIAVDMATGVLYGLAGLLVPSYVRIEPITESYALVDTRALENTFISWYGQPSAGHLLFSTISAPFSSLGISALHVLLLRGFRLRPPLFAVWPTQSFATAVFFITTPVEATMVAWAVADTGNPIMYAGLVWVTTLAAFGLAQATAIGIGPAVLVFLAELSLWIVLSLVVGFLLSYFLLLLLGAVAALSIAVARLRR